MKLHGDVPEQHKKLALELEEAEQYWDNRVENDAVPEEVAAKAYVCLAHDWYDIGLDDEGQRLLYKAALVCPNYFEKIIHQHTELDEEYAYLVNRINEELAFILVNRIQDMSKK